MFGGAEGVGEIWPRDQTESASFCIAQKLRMAFTHLNSWKKEAYFLIHEIQISVTVNKIFIGIQTCSFIHMFSMAGCLTGRVE